MLPRHHFLASVITAAALYPFFGIDVWLIVAAGVLVDVDHYFIYIWRFKDFNLKKAFAYFHGVSNASDLYPIFHMVEFLLIMWIIALFSKIFLLIAISLSIHLAMDFVGEHKIRYTKRNFCFLYLLFKSEKNK